MPLRILITAGLLLLGLSAYAQKDWARAFETDCDSTFLCQEFGVILKEITHHLREEDGANAYRELKALEACDKCPEHRDNLDDLSDEIIHLFREQNESLDSLLTEQKRIVDNLTTTTRALRSERNKVDRQLEINERMTQDALVSNYLRLANKYYQQENEIGKQEALWLTDFAYNYVDSSHHEVKKMMYRLFNEQLYDYYAYDPSAMLDAEEEGLGVGNVIAMDWSPDGEWLATGFDNGRLLIFNRDGEVVFDDLLSTEQIMDLHWNQESKRLAVGLNTTMVGFLEQDAENWILSNQVLNIGNEVGTVRWSPTQADKLAVATLGTTIFLYEGAGTNPILTLEGHEDWIRDLAWSPDGQRMISCDDEGVIIQWSGETGKLLFKRDGHTDYARTVDWHPNGQTFLSGGDDNQVILWDSEGEVLNRLNFEGWVYQARYSESGQDIGVIIGEETFYRITSNERLGNSLPETVKCFAWRGEQNTVVPEDGLFLDVESADFLIPLQASLPRIGRQVLGNTAAEIGAISHLNWSPDGQFLAYVKDDKLEIVTRDSIISIGLEGVAINDLAWHPGLSEELPASNFLATISSDLQLRLWDVASLSIVSSEELSTSGLAIDWSPDGKLLAVVNVNGELVIYDRQLTELYREQYTNDYIRTVAWSPNGRQVLLGSDDNSIVVFGWEKKKIAERLSTHTDWVRKVLWLDNNHFTSSGDDGQTIIWGNNNREGKFQPLHKLGVAKGFHVSAAYQATSSGGILAVGTSDNQLSRWLLDQTFQPTLDTLLRLESVVSDLDWRPGSESLALGSYSSVPQEYNRYLQLQSAYDSSIKPVEARVISEVLMSEEGGLVSYFYLPKIRVLPNRYDQVAWSKDERYLAYIDYESIEHPYNQIQLHDLVERTAAYTYSLPDADITHLGISPDNRYLTLAPDLGYFIIVNLNDPTDSLRFSLGETEMVTWQWSPSSRYLAVLDRNYDIFLYDTRKRKVEKFTTEISDYDQGLVLFHPREERRMYIVNHQGVYEVSPGGTAAAQLIYPVPSATQFNPPDALARATWINNGQELLYVQEGLAPTLLTIEPGVATIRHKMGDPENFYTWTGAPAERLYEIHPMDQDKSDFNGKELEYARVWDIATGEPVSILRGIRTQLVTEMELSTDGQRLATLGDALEPYQGKYNRSNPTVRIWDVERQNNIFDLRLDGTQNLSFSPQGNYLITYFNNGQVGLWPLETSKINRYFANSDKDLYLERLSSKDNQPFLDRIEEWELEKGINFQEENFGLIKKREIAQIRQNWGEYYVNKAWLNRDQETVEASFDKARVLHYVNNTSRIRSSPMDTLALVNIWIERTYYALGKNDEQAAEEALLNAQRLRPGLTRLVMLDLLLGWQDGRREGLIQALLDGEALTIQEEYANWDRRDIHLKDETFYLRLVALVQSRPDIVSPIAEPRMAKLLEDVDPVTREQLLVSYYRINATNPNLIQPGMRQAYFEAAVAFLEDDWAATEADSDRLQDYISYNYYLQDLELGKKKPKRAVRNARNNQKAAESLLAIDARNVTYQGLYLATLAEEAMLEMRLDLRTAGKVTQRLSDARRAYPNVEAPYLELQLANAHLLIGDEETAYQYYYALLEKYDPAGMEDLLKEELNAVDPAANARVNNVLQYYRTYRQARDAYWAEKPFFTLATLETEAPDLTDADWTGYEQVTKAWYDASLVLDKAGMLPKDSLGQHLEEYNRSVGDRVYLMLYSGNWELVAPTMEQFREDLPLQKWPIAVDAVLAILKDDWPVARRLINEVKDLPNDGILTEEFSTLRDFLLNLPQRIRKRTEFVKRWEDWQGRLDRR